MSWGILTRLGATVAVGLVLVGCDSIRGSQEPVTDSSDLAIGASGCMSDSIVLRMYNDKAWGDLAPPKDAAGNPVTDVTKICPRGNMDRKEYREMVIGYRLNVYDKRFQELTDAMQRAKVGVSLGSEILDAILDLAGTVFGGAATKSILSAASGAANAGRNAIDTNIFYKQTVAAIVAKMEASRARISSAINEKRGAVDAAYPLDLALSDLNALERAGSIDRAIGEITEDAKREAKKAEDVKQKQIITTYSVAEVDFFAKNTARINAVGQKLATASNELILSYILKPLPFRGPEREATAKEREAILKKDRSDPAVAKIILREWAIGIRSEEEMVHWEKMVGITK